MHKIILAILLFAAPVWATDYYADPAGSGTTCSSGSPCTVAAGITKAAPGDTLYLKDGVYSAFSEDNNVIYIPQGEGGSAGNIFTIRAEHKGSAVVTCGAKTTDYRGILFSTDASYVTIKDLTIHNCDLGIMMNANNDHNILIGNTIYDVRTGISGGSDCDYLTTDSNLVYDFGVVGSSQYHGIYFRGVDGVVQNNIIYNNLGSGAAIQIGSYSTLPSGTWKIVNNTLDGYGGGNHWQIALYDNDITNLYVDNNISYNSAYPMLYVSGKKGTASWTQKNNLIAGTATLCAGYEGDTTYCASITTANNLTNTNPLFVDAGSRDYTLQSGSPARDAALDTHAPALDIIGTTRVAYDIGAYEYVAPSPADPPIVTTGLFSNLAATSVTVGGAVTDNGGGTILACGIAYGTSADPTTSGTKVACAGGEIAVGAFSKAVTGLQPCTLYHFRAYATNESSTTYGTDTATRTSGPCAPGDWTSATTTDMVALDNIQGVSFDDVANGGSLTNFAVGNHTNRVLLVAVSEDSGAVNDITGVTWNTSESLTKVAEVTGNNYDYVTTVIWQLVNPTVTTASISATWNGTNKVRIEAVSLYNVDNSDSNPIRNSNTASSLSGVRRDSALTITTESGDFCLSSVIAGNGASAVSAIAPYGSETERWDEELATGSSTQVGGYSLTASGASTVIGANWTAGSTGNTAYAHVAACVIPSSTVSLNWYTPATTKPYAVKSSGTPLTHVADDAACPASIDGADKWCHKASENRIYVQVTGGGNPGAVTIQCSKPSTGGMMGLF